MSAAHQLKVKWGKEVLTLNVDVKQTTLAQLKEQLAELTTVPVDKQKLLGLKQTASASGDSNSNNTMLSSLGIKPNGTIMLIGSPEGTAVPQVKSSESAANAKTSSSSSSANTMQGGTKGDNSGVKNDALHATHECKNGLKNIANTCYMNAAIQMLRMIPEIKDALSSYNGRDNLLIHIKALLHSLHNTQDTVTPLSFWTSLIQDCPTFAERDEHGMFMQQDSQEVLNLLLTRIATILPTRYKRLYSGTLHQTLSINSQHENKENNNKNKKNEESNEEEEKKNEEEETTNNANVNVNETDVPFTMLTCNISGEVQTLESGLEKAFDETFEANSTTTTTNSDNNNIVNTNNTSANEVVHHRISRIAALPEYVFVHLVRFS